MQSETTAQQADEEAVRDLYRKLMDGWNRGSGEDFAAVFTEDGDLVAYDGTHFEGCDEIAPFHQELFDGWMKGIEEEYRLALLDAETALVERFIERTTHPETCWDQPWA